MLDTNICIYVLKNNSNQLRRKFTAIKHLCISSVTYAELCYGIENSENTKKAERWNQLDQFTQRLLVDSWDEEAAKHYGAIQSLLRREGTPIGNNDLMIASHARRLDAVLVTNNVRQFERVPDLTIENWVK